MPQQTQLILFITWCIVNVIAKSMSLRYILKKGVFRSEIFIGNEWTYNYQKK